MTVGQQKQKWTAEEEAALRAGVERYGAGKWRAIQKDEEFGPVLVSRSNVDLKDKWRNISATVNGHRNRKTGISQKSGRRGKSQDESDKEDLSPISDTKMLGTKYDSLITGAIASLNEPNGSSMADIAEFIEVTMNESQAAVPPAFKKLVVGKLRTMVHEGKLVKVQQNYKINDELTPDGRAKFPRGRLPDDKAIFPVTKKLRTDSFKRVVRLDPESAERRKTAEEASRLAAIAVAQAEQAALAAELAAKEAEYAEQQAEHLQAIADAALAKSSKKVKLGREAIAVTV